MRCAGILLDLLPKARMLTRSRCASLSYSGPHTLVRRSAWVTTRPAFTCQVGDDSIRLASGYGLAAEAGELLCEVDLQVSALEDRLGGVARVQLGAAHHRSYPSHELGRSERLG